MSLLSIKTRHKEILNEIEGYIRPHDRIEKLNTDDLAGIVKQLRSRLTEIENCIRRPRQPRLADEKVVPAVQRLFDEHKDDENTLKKLATLLYDGSKLHRDIDYKELPHAFETNYKLWNDFIQEVDKVLASSSVDGSSTISFDSQSTSVPLSSPPDPKQLRLITQRVKSLVHRYQTVSQGSLPQGKRQPYPQDLDDRLLETRIERRPEVKRVNVPTNLRSIGSIKGNEADLDTRQLRMILKNRDAQIAKLKKKVAAYEEEQAIKEHPVSIDSVLDDELEEMPSQKSVLQKTIRDLTSNVDELEKELEIASSTIMDLQEEVQTLKQEKMDSKLSEDEIDGRSSSADLERGQTQSTNNIEIELEKRQAQITKLEIDVEILTTSQSELQAEIASMTKTCQSQNERIGNLEQENSRLLDEKKDSSAQIHEWGIHYKKLSDEKQLLTGEHMRLVGQSAVLEAKVKELRERGDDWRDKYNKEADENETWKKLHESDTAALKSLAKEHETKVIALAAVSQDLDTITKQNKILLDKHKTEKKEMLQKGLEAEQAHIAELDQLEEKHQQNLSSAEDRHLQERQTLIKTHTDELEGLKRVHHEEQIKLQGIADQLNNQKTDLAARHKEETTRLRKELGISHRNELDQLELAHDEYTKTLTKTLLKKHDEEKERMQGIIKQLEAKKGALTGEHEEELSRLKDKHTKEVESLNKVIVEQQKQQLKQDRFTSLTDSQLLSGKEKNLIGFNKFFDQVDNVKLWEWKDDQNIWPRSLLSSQNISEKRLKRAILGDHLWAILLKGVFCSPFRILGGEGEGIEKTWIKPPKAGFGTDELFRTEYFTWPKPSSGSERFRYETCNKALQALTQPASPLEERGKLKKSFVDHQTELKKQSLALISELVDVDQKKEKELVDLLAAAARLWLIVCTQRYRVFLAFPELKGSTAKEKVALAKENKLVLLQRPGINRYGSDIGLNLEEVTSVTKTMMEEIYGHQ